MKQSTILIAKSEFGLMFNGARGSAAHVKVGDRFLVTSSEVSNRCGFATIDQEKKAMLSCGYKLAIADIEKLFEIVA